MQYCMHLSNLGFPTGKWIDSIGLTNYSNQGFNPSMHNEMDLEVLEIKIQLNLSEQARKQERSFREFQNKDTYQSENC